MTVQFCAEHRTAILYGEGELHLAGGGVQNVPFHPITDEGVPAVLVCEHCWEQVPKHLRVSEGKALTELVQAYGQKFAYVHEGEHGMTEYVLGERLKEYAPRASATMAAAYSAWSREQDMKFVSALIDFFVQLWKFGTRVRPTKVYFVAPGVVSVTDTHDVMRPYFDRTRWAAADESHCGGDDELQRKLRQQYGIGKLTRFAALERDKCPVDTMLQSDSRVSYHARLELVSLLGDTFYTSRDHRDTATTALEQRVVGEVEARDFLAAARDRYRNK